MRHRVGDRGGMATDAPGLRRRPNAPSHDLSRVLIIYQRRAHPAEAGPDVDVCRPDRIKGPTDFLFFERSGSAHTKFQCPLTPVPIESTPLDREIFR